jgi:hypothetical protein
VADTVVAPHRGLIENLVDLVNNSALGLATTTPSITPTFTLAIAAPSPIAIVGFSVGRRHWAAGYSIDGGRCTPACPSRSTLWSWPGNDHSPGVELGVVRYPSSG